LKRFVSKQVDGSTLLKRSALVLIVILYVCYISLAKTAFVLFYCVSVTVDTSLEDDTGPKKFWALDTSKECFLGSHLVATLTITVPILIFLFFFPVFVAARTVMVRSKKKLGSKDALETLNILYQDSTKRQSFGIP